MKRVIPVNTEESAYPPTVDPSASVGQAIMRVPIVRKVGCFTSYRDSFVVYVYHRRCCCCCRFRKRMDGCFPLCLPSVSILNLYSLTFARQLQDNYNNRRMKSSLLLVELVREFLSIWQLRRLECVFYFFEFYNLFPLFITINYSFGFIRSIWRSICIMVGWTTVTVLHYQSDNYVTRSTRLTSIVWLHLSENDHTILLA